MVKILLSPLENGNSHTKTLPIATTITVSTVLTSIIAVVLAMRRCLDKKGL